MLQRRSRKSRTDRSVHRSGDAVLTSPRVVVDADGEFLYIPADRALAARAQREAEEAARVAAAEAEAAQAEAEAEAEIAAAEAEIAAAEAEIAEAEIAAAEEAAEAELSEAAELEAAERRAAEVQAARVKIAAQSRAAQEEAAQVRAAQLEAAQTEALAQAQAMARARAAEADVTPAAAAYRASRAVPAEPENADYPSDLEVAIAGARLAARRRATIMALLFLATVVSWVLAASSSPAWVAAPATVLLVLHMLASRVAGLRSRESLMLLAVQVHSEELAESRAQRQAAAAARPAEVAATVEAALTPDRVSRRAAAVGASTWDPVPVPPPTYTLKPAVHRPEPAPLDVPAPAAVSRGALPRRAADVERILGVESDLDELFEEPKVVNG